MREILIIVLDICLSGTEKCSQRYLYIFYLNVNFGAIV